MVRRDPRVEPLVLTPQDRRVLRLLPDGLTNSEMGRRLDLREDTVKWHVTCILRYARARWPWLPFENTTELAPYFDEMLRQVADEPLARYARKRAGRPKPPAARRSGMPSEPR